MIKISVITVAYNSATTIEKTIQSILNQSQVPYEYLIIDGKSTDGTVELAQLYQETFIEKKIHYRIFSEEDQGIYDAMNKGIRKASGNFIAILNSDDWYENTAIETVMKTYRENPFDLAYGSIRYIGRNGKEFIKKSRLDIFVSSRNWNHPSSFVRRRLCLEHPFDSRWEIYADFAWFLKLRKKTIKIANFPEEKVIVNFQVGGVSINKSWKSMRRRAKEKYQAYRENGYGRIYIVESYGWEFVKYCFAILYT